MMIHCLNLLLMYKLKKAFFSCDVESIFPFRCFFSVGNKRNGTMGCWSLLGANSSLIRRSSLLGGELLVKE